MKKISLAIVSLLALVSLNQTSAFATTGLVDNDTAVKFVQFQEKNSNASSSSSANNGNSNDSNSMSSNSNINDNADNQEGNQKSESGADSNKALPNTGEAEQTVIAVAGLTALVAAAYVMNRKFN